jgi:hypothetical protein
MRNYLVALITIGLASSTYASVVEYHNNKAEWEAAVGSFTTIDFTGFNFGQPIPHDYYSPLGFTFLNTNWAWHTTAFPNDGEGVISANGGSRFRFDQPRYALAVDHPGSHNYLLYYNGALIYTSTRFDGPGGMGGGFAGIISTMPFDEVLMTRLHDPTSPVFYDDLHFGPPIPAPGALALLVAGALCRIKRRRRG